MGPPEANNHLLVLSTFPVFTVLVVLEVELLIQTDWGFLVKKSLQSFFLFNWFIGGW